MNRELIERLRSVRFTAVRRRESYSMGEVDDLLDSLVEAETRGTSLAPLIQVAGLRSGRWREGYDIVEVDQFLAGIAEESQRRQPGATADVPLSAENAAVHGEDLVQQVESARFTPVRLREGYDMGEVDQCLDQVAASLARGKPVRPLVDGVVFTPVRFREGYDMGEVDRFLDGMVEQSERRERGTTAGVPLASTNSAAHAGSHPVAAAESPSVIEEQHGLLRRMFGRK